MKSKWFIAGIVVGVVLSTITNYGVVALTAPTAMNFDFGEFEIELLNYQLRAFRFIPYLKHSDFQNMIDYTSQYANVSLVDVPKNQLREITYDQILPGEEGPILIIDYETKTIYFRIRDEASRELRFYYWSSIA